MSSKTLTESSARNTQRITQIITESNAFLISSLRLFVIVTNILKFKSFKGCVLAQVSSQNISQGNVIPSMYLCAFTSQSPHPGVACGIRTPHASTANLSNSSRQLLKTFGADDASLHVGCLGDSSSEITWNTNRILLHHPHLYLGGPLETITCTFPGWRPSKWNMTFVFGVSFWHLSILAGITVQIP